MLYEKCLSPTPVHQSSIGVRFKREDLFKPFEDSPVNGTKLRQCIWLVKNLSAGKKRVVSAASVRSPQLAMAAKVSKEFGKECVLFVGSSNLEAAKKNPMVKLADEYGAHFNQAPCPFNSALQKTARDFVQEGDYFLEYGISTTQPDHWKDFYSFGGLATANIPQDIEKIIIPAGSCNSVLSLLIGLYNSDRLFDFEYHLVGVGPSKYQMLMERFEHVTQTPLPEDKITYDDLHGVYQYSDSVPFSLEGINFHPTYEGKVMTHLFNNRRDFLHNDKNLFWIVGGEVK